MKPYDLPKWANNIQRWIRKVGIFLSLGYASYKALDNRRWALSVTDRLDAKQEEIDDLRSNNEVTRANLKALIYNVSAASMDFDDLPMPMWYKIYDHSSDTYRMVYINRAYEKEHGVDKIEYLGMQDYRIVPEEYAKTWRTNDNKAFWSRSPVEAIEPDGYGGEIRVMKWRLDKGGETFIYGLQLERINGKGKG